MYFWREVACWNDGQGEFEEMASGTTESAVELSRSRIATRDIAMMMYTSGTTAMPKGCPISHEALVRPALEAGIRNAVF